MKLMFSVNTCLNLNKVGAYMPVALFELKGSEEYSYGFSNQSNYVVCIEY